MKISTENNKRIMGVQKIDSLYYTARACGLTSMEMSERFINILEHLKAPQWVNWYLRGYRDCLWAGLFQNDLEFCYIVDGKRYSIRKDSELYYEKHGISPKELSDKQTSSGHYWIKTGKPF